MSKQCMRRTLQWLSLLALAPPPSLLALLQRPAPSWAPQAPQAPQARLSVVDWNAYDERDNDGPGTYSFGYDIEDPASGNTQYRQEERFSNGTVSGSYGLLEPDGNVRVVTYVADALGYRVRIENSVRREENYPRTRPSPPLRTSPGTTAGRKEWTDPNLRRNSWPDSEWLEGAAPSPAMSSALLSVVSGPQRGPEQRQRPASSAAQGRPPTVPRSRARPEQPGWESKPIVVWDGAGPNQRLPAIPLLDRLIYNNQID